MTYFHMIIIGESHGRIDDELRYINISTKNSSIIKLVEEQDCQKLLGIELDKNIIIAYCGYNKRINIFEAFIKTRIRR